MLQSTRIRPIGRATIALFVLVVMFHARRQILRSQDFYGFGGELLVPV
jgi:hypothetical protein